MGVLVFLLFFALPLVGIALQLIPKRISGVRFKDTDPEHAWFLVAQYAEGTFEQKFGYPSGYFHLHEKKSVKPNRVLAVEAQPSGSVTDGCALGTAGLGLAGFDEGLGAGCITTLLAAMIALPFFAISTADRFFRRVLRSRVDVRLEVDGADSVANFGFYGIGGYVLHKRYAAVFDRPVLPVDIFPPNPTPATAAVTAGAPGPRDGTAPPVEPAESVPTGEGAGPA